MAFTIKQSSPNIRHIFIHAYKYITVSAWVGKHWGLCYPGEGSCQKPGSRSASPIRAGRQHIDSESWLGAEAYR